MLAARTERRNLDKWTVRRHQRSESAYDERALVDRMAPAPEEVDVFSGPHSRMKELVRIYSDKLTVTDFSDYADLRGLLWSLRSTFREFKTHECIENECIMEKLKHRLDFLKVENQAVYKVHSDNRLSEIQDLLEEGCYKTEHCYSPSEMRTIGSNIREALEVFTKHFLPHMQEEEELFQPLLMQYFTYEELKQIRYDVIEKHALHTKYCSDGDKEFSSDDTLAEKVDDVKEEEEDTAPSKISGLPTEVLLQILSYLSPKDLCHCAQVNTRWNQLSMDGELWKSLNPVKWAQGDWRFISESDDDVQDMDEDDEGIFVTVDEDADFDESESSAYSDDKDSYEVNQSMMSIRREAKMLDGIAKYLIPVVGHGVEALMLSHSKGLNNAVVYRLLSNTPNLKFLDLSFTRVSDIAFKGFGKSGSGRQLKHLNLSGCTSITDTTLKRLTSAMSLPLEREQQKGESFRGSGGQSCSSGDCGKNCCKLVSIDELSKDKNGRPKPQCIETSANSSLHHEPYEVHVNQISQVTRHRSRHDSKHSPTLDGFHDDVYKSDSVCQTTNLACDDTACRTEDTGNSQKGYNIAHKTCCSLISKTEGSSDEDKGDGTVVESSKLEFLSLAGCYRISDDGLRYLAGNGGLPYLKHLDLSGCVSVTSTGLNQLAAACVRLEHEEFFYCDNISEGPYADTASGCQNLQCKHLVCCRSGE